MKRHERIPGVFEEHRGRFNGRLSVAMAMCCLEDQDLPVHILGTNVSRGIALSGGNMTASLLAIPGSKALQARYLV